MFKARLKALSVLRRYASSSATGKEVEIPMPWGVVAGKWWGPQDKRPIVTLHGWQDNCGSFDRLIPLLPSEYSFLALDFPGHGLSSRLPPGLAYHDINGVVLLRQIIEKFDWDKIALMGHSMGAIVSYKFNMIFPHMVDFTVLIDGLTPLINPKGLGRVKESIEAFLKYDKFAQSTSEPPSYTRTEMYEMMHKSSRKSIEIESARYLLERNIAPSQKNPGKFYFTRDPRIKSGPLLNWPMNEIMEGTKAITAPMLVCRAEKSVVPTAEKVAKEAVAILDGKGIGFEMHVVPGKHHGHLNNPEDYAKLISTFIHKHGKLHQCAIPSNALKDT